MTNQTETKQYHCRHCGKTIAKWGDDLYRYAGENIFCREKCMDDYIGGMPINKRIKAAFLLGKYRGEYTGLCQGIYWNSETPKPPENTKWKMPKECETKQSETKQYHCRHCGKTIAKHGAAMSDYAGDNIFCDNRCFDDYPNHPAILDKSAWLLHNHNGDITGIMTAGYCRKWYNL